jgi:hypothetical protein
MHSKAVSELVGWRQLRTQPQGLRYSAAQQSGTSPIPQALLTNGVQDHLMRQLEVGRCRQGGGAAGEQARRQGIARAPLDWGARGCAQCEYNTGAAACPGACACRG